MSDKLTPVLIKARARILISAIFFAKILYEQCRLVVDDKIPSACTDGTTIRFGAGFSNKLSLPECLFVLCHEIYHVMAMHPKRMREYAQRGSLRGYPFDAGLYNIAADAVINKCLVDSKIGRMPEDGVWLEKIARFKDGQRTHQPDYVVTGTELPEDIYVMLMEQIPPEQRKPRKPKRAGAGRPCDDEEQGQGQGEGECTPKDFGGSGESGDLEMPDAATADKQNENEMRATIQGALEQAKSQGTQPAHLERFFSEFLEPQVKWQNELRKRVVAAVQPDRYDWSRPNRRRLMLQPDIYMPRRVSTRAGTIALAVDTSGSISNNELAAFMGEASSILSSVRPRKLLVIWCDARVDRVDEIKDASELRRITQVRPPSGGGGTSFIPPFEYLRDHGLANQVQIMIYATDLLGPEPGPELVPMECIWLCTTGRTAKTGRTIKLDVK